MGVFRGLPLAVHLRLVWPAYAPRHPYPSRLRPGSTISVDDGNAADDARPIPVDNRGRRTGGVGRPQMWLFDRAVLIHAGRGRIRRFFKFYLPFTVRVTVD